MAVDKHGWFDWAIRDPGYPGGVNGGVNSVVGVVPHSAEGNFTSLKHLRDFHWGRATAPEGQRASWGATNLKDGRFVQHYPIYAQTWTSGCGFLNNNFFAWENEGRAGEPLTDAQNDNNIRLIRELSALKGWKLRRPVDSKDVKATGYEHGESVRFGGAATACPSGRIPWDLYLKALNEEEEEVKTLRIWCAERSQTWLLSGCVAVPVVSAADDKAFEKLYGPHAAVLTGAQLDALAPR